MGNKCSLDSTCGSSPSKKTPERTPPLEVSAASVSIAQDTYKLVSNLSPDSQRENLEFIARKYERNLNTLNNSTKTNNKSDISIQSKTKRNQRRASCFAQPRRGYEKHKRPLFQVREITENLNESFKEENSDELQNKRKINFCDGSSYKGEWFKGKAEGNGIWEFKNGDVYQGEFSKGVASGTGTYRFRNGNFYKGNWKNGLFEGEGEEVWKDGTVVKCRYKEGEKQGDGEIRFPDLSIYKGEFRNGKITGKGEFWFKDGKVYKGEFLDGKMHGKGVLKWKDGRIYIGEYFEDKKHGYGEYRYQDGRIYQGYWEAGRQHGEGKILKNEVVLNQGVWVRGRLRRPKRKSRDEKKVSIIEEVRKIY